MLPERAIYTATDLKGFIDSPAYRDLNLFIRQCGAAIHGSTISEAALSMSPTVAQLTSFFARLSSVVDAVPPMEQSMRFGNKAFRSWHTELKKEIPLFLNDFLPLHLLEHAEELGGYLQCSFGNEIRLDYGTGHESFLVIFLFCLSKLEIISSNDCKALILSSFNEYMKTVRKIQTVYLLEPAGSHGVWGLDDYQCLVFLWGAAQLKGHPDITPQSIHDDSVLNEIRDEYLYLDGIRFIKHIKHGAAFAETSPMLNDISFLGDWGKVLNGLLRLYDGEVLNKLPVAQHFLFGNIFQATWVQSSEVERNSSSKVGTAFGTNIMRPSPAVGGTVFRSMHGMGAPRTTMPNSGAKAPEEAEYEVASGVRTTAPWAAHNHNV